MTVGICGASCSGKTSITRALLEELGPLSVNLFALDHYFIIKGERFYVDVDGQQVRTLERPESYQGERLAQDIVALQKRGHVVTRQTDT